MIAIECVMELCLKHLTHMYGNLCALDDVGLTLTPGIYGLLGPNGSGKSTMMNIITGNLKQTSGQVLWNGQDTAEDSRSLYHDLGYMPQIQTYYPNFSAMEFMCYMASLKDMDSTAARKEIRSILMRLELYEIRHRKIKTFSGGMRQRLLLGQALLNHPKLLILDEPTAGMDPKQRIAISRMIGELSRDSIVLISTHVVSDIEFIAKEVILLQQGRILKKDSVAKLCHGLEGRVFDISLQDDNLDAFHRDKQKIVTGYVCDSNGIRARIIRNAPPDCLYQEASPTLEEVYMYYISEADHVF